MSTYYRHISRAIQSVEEAERAVYSAQTNLREQQVNLGYALRCCREEKGISLRKVADHLKLSAAFISDCELGRRNLSAEKRSEYMKLLRPLLSLKPEAVA